MPTIIGQVHYNYHSEVPPSTSSGEHSSTRHNRTQKRERDAPAPRKKGTAEMTPSEAPIREWPPAKQMAPKGDIAGMRGWLMAQVGV